MGLFVNTGIGACCDEICFRFNDIANDIVRVCAKSIRQMTWAHFDDKDGAIMNKFVTARLTLKQDENSDKAKCISVTVKDFISELWPPNYEHRMQSLWKPVVKFLLPTLDSDWHLALEDGTWHGKVEEVFELDDAAHGASHKYQFKGIFLHCIVRGMLAVQVGKGVFGYYRIKQKLQNDGWRPDSLFMVWMWLVKNWPEWIIHFYSPTKYVKKHALKMSDLLGLRLLHVCWLLIHMETSSMRFQNINVLAHTTLDVMAYQWNSQLDNLPMPKSIADNAELLEWIWNMHHRDQHHTMTSNYYAVVLIQSMFVKHKPLMLALYGKGRYDQNKGIHSRYMHQTEPESGIKVIMDNYVDDWEPLNGLQIEAIKFTIDHLADIKHDFQPRLLIGLSQYVKNRTNSGLCYGLWLFCSLQTKKSDFLCLMLFFDVSKLSDKFLTFLVVCCSVQAKRKISCVCCCFLVCPS